MDVKRVSVNIDSDTAECSSDTDEYDTAEEYPDSISIESFYSFDDAVEGNEVIHGDYHDIAFIDEDSSYNNVVSVPELNKHEALLTGVDKEKEPLKHVHENTSSTKNDFDIRRSDSAEQNHTKTEVSKLKNENRNVGSSHKELVTVVEAKVGVGFNNKGLNQHKLLKSELKGKDSENDSSIFAGDSEMCFGKEFLNQHKSVQSATKDIDRENYDVHLEGSETLAENQIFLVKEIKTDTAKGYDYHEIESQDINENDIKELSFKEKLAYFEKFGMETGTRANAKSPKDGIYVSDEHLSEDTNTKTHMIEEDSSDEKASSVSNETSYEDLLESLLESEQIEVDSKKHHSESDDFENSDVEQLCDETKQKVTTENMEFDQQIIVHGAIAEESSKDSELTSELDYIIPSKAHSFKSQNIKSEDRTDANFLCQQPKKDLKVPKNLSLSVAPEKKESISDNKTDPVIQLVELGVSQMNDLSHQNHLFCAKLVYDSREPEIKQNLEASASCEMLPSVKNGNQNKTYLLPTKIGSPIYEVDNGSDHVINRQSSVIKENRLTKMPFADCSDSEILNDTQGSLKMNGKHTEQTNNAVVQTVELGTASLLEGSHYKNLRHAKLVNPFISLRRTGVLEQITGSDVTVTPAKLINTNMKKLVGDDLVVAKQESPLVPEVCISVAASTLDTLDKVKDTEQPTKGQTDEHERRNKVTKSLRRRIGRHNAIVSEYVANIERAESLRNSVVIEDVTKLDSNEEIQNSEKSVDKSHKTVQKCEIHDKGKEASSVIRTVEMGTACLYEIPHLKYLHCAKIVSPSSR